MKTIQSGEIEVDTIDGHSWAWKTLRAERKKGESQILLTVPAGPRTAKTVTMKVSEEEFIRLAQWMRGEIR